MSTIQKDLNTSLSMVCIQYESAPFYCTNAHLIDINYKQQQISSELRYVDWVLISKQASSNCILKLGKYGAYIIYFL